MCYRQQQSRSLVLSGQEHEQQELGYGCSQDCTDGLMQEIDKCGQKGGKHTSNGIYFEYALFIPILQFELLTTT